MKVLSILIGLLIFVAVALGGLYFGASWYVGQKIEKESTGVMKHWQESTKKYGAQWTVKQYKRQILSSEIITQITWPQMDDPAVVATGFMCQTKIKHGPFLGFKLGFFVSESACQLDQSTDEALMPFKGLTLLSEEALVDFDGSFKGKLNLRPLQNPLKMAHQTSLIWKGCSYDISYKVKTHLLKATGLCHGFDFLNQEEGQSNDLSVGDFQVMSEAVIPELTKGIMQAQKSQMQIQIPEGIKIRKGDQTFDIKTVTLGQNTELDASKLSSGQFKLGVAQVIGPDLNVGPITLELGFERIMDALSVLAHRKEGRATPEELQIALLNGLKADPQLSINKLRVEIGPDYFDFNVKFKMTPVTAEDLANPMSLLNHLDLSGGVEVTETFYDKVTLLAIKDPNARAMTQTQNAAQLAELKQSGFVIQNGSVLKAPFKFQQGEMWINEKSLGIPVAGLLGGLGGFGSAPSGRLPQMDMPVDPSAPVEAPVETVVPPPTSVSPRDFSLSDKPSAVPDEPKPEPPQSKPQPVAKPKPTPTNNYFRQDR